MRAILLFVLAALSASPQTPQLKAPADASRIETCRSVDGYDHPERIALPGPILTLRREGVSLTSHQWQRRYVKAQPHRSQASLADNRGSLLYRKS